MKTIDIRAKSEKVVSVIFADNEGESGRAVSLQTFLPEQCNIISIGGQSMHVKMIDIDNMILALRYAKENWS